MKCECTIPTGGFCERHQVEKPAHFVKLCQTNLVYFRAWEQGRGPGQNMGAVNPKQKPKINSRIGDILASKFESLGIVPVPGCPCHAVQKALNEVTPEAALSNIDHWTHALQRSARKWKELKGGIWNFVPTPPLMLCKKVLLDAIEEAKGTPTT